MILSRFYKKIFRSLIAFVFLTGVTFAAPITVTVNLLTDLNPVAPLPGISGELRWAINMINANPDGGTILFNIPGSAPHTIYLAESLPDIVKPVTINGNSQPGNGYSGSEPKIVLNGNNISSFVNGLYLNLGSDNSIIENIGITRFIGNGIVLGSNYNQIRNNVIYDFRDQSPLVDKGNFMGILGNNNAVTGNLMGINHSNQVQLNAPNIGGIVIYQFSPGLASYNKIGGNGANRNIITSIQDRHIIEVFGLGLDDGGACNQISQNLLYKSASSSFGAIKLTNRGNFEYNSPVITGFNLGTVYGTTAQPNDVIEIFGTPYANQAKQYLTTAVADAAGNWSAFVGYPSWLYLTATATFNNLSYNCINTSGLSETYTIPDAPAPCDMVVSDQTPKIVLDQPLNFAVADPSTDNFVFTVNSVPALVPPLTTYTLRAEIALEMVDPVTGALVPDWANALVNVVPGISPPFPTGTFPPEPMNAYVTAGSIPKTYYWRVGVIYQPPTSYQPILWSATHKFIVNPVSPSIPAEGYLTDNGQHTNNINWVYGVSYLDDGKTSEGIAYIDGLGKSRQVQSLMNSTNTVMAVEAAYSEEGGGTAMSLPAPITDGPAGQFGYSYRFFDVFDGTNWSDFSTKDFDREIKGATVNTLMPPSAVDQTNGVGEYYSTANTTEAYVDAAMGYPYAYNVPYNSPLQRPMLSAAGVGVDFKMTSGKEYKHFYGHPSQEELDRVYGVLTATGVAAAPLRDKISRTITYNPDGVGSVSYTDNEGKLIATALTVCNAPSLKALNEDGMTGFTVHVNPLNTDVMDPTSLVKTASSKFFIPCCTTTVDVKYDVDLTNFKLNDNSLCTDCKYDVEVHILNESTGAEVYTYVNHALVPIATTCPNSPSSVNLFNEELPLCGPANFIINRIIKPYVSPEGESILTTALNAYNTYLEAPESDLLETFTNQYNTQTDYYVLRKQKIIAPPVQNGTYACDLKVDVTTPTGSTMGTTLGSLAAAKYNKPTGFAWDMVGGRGYIADQGNNRIQQIVGGNVALLAGQTAPGFIDGLPSVAQFNSPYDVVFRPGDAYSAACVIVADKINNAIRKVDVLTGNTTTLLIAANGISAPEGLGIDASGVIYIASTGNSKLYKYDLSTGTLTQIASGYTFNQPTDIAMGLGGTLYVTDRGLQSLLKINSAGSVSLISNTFTSPSSVSVEQPGGNVFVCDQGNNKISHLNVTTNVIQVVAGTGAAGNLDGALSVAQFDAPVGIWAYSPTIVVVADKDNHRMRILNIDYCTETIEKPTSYEWYPDQTNVTDIIDAGYTKQLNQLDGDMDLDLQPGDEHYKLTSLNLLSAEPIPAVGTPPAANSILKKFIDSYLRINWIDLTDKITAMDIYDVGLGSELTSTISTIDEDNKLLTADQQGYYVLKVTSTKPSCEEACNPVNPTLDCNQQCHEQQLAMNADRDAAYNQLATSTKLYPSGPSGANQSFQLMVSTLYPLTTYWYNQLTLMDQALYENYDEKRKAAETFNLQTCLALCPGTSPPSPCETCPPLYDGCVNEHITTLTEGYEFLMDAWDNTTTNPSGAFPYAYADLMHTSGSTTYADDDLANSLGIDLLEYLASKINSSTLNTTRADWNNTTGTVACSTCQAPSSTSPSCPAAPLNNVSSFPLLLLPVLETLNADCITEYTRCLQMNGTAQQQNDYLCAENRDQCIDFFGPEPMPNNSGNATWVTWNDDITACGTSYANCISTPPVHPTSADQMRSDLILNTLLELYPSPSQTTTVTALLDQLIALTLTLSFNELQAYMVNYADSQGCILDCQQTLTDAFNQWIKDLKEEAASSINQTFIDGCYANLNEKLDISYTQSIYHYTLYNYDFANNLVSTIPPEGIDYIDLTNATEYTPAPNRASRVPEHRMLSTYKSTSLYTITASSPDEGSTRYLYDKAGRLRFSQTAEQMARGAAASPTALTIFSYVKYDSEYRVIESGEYREPAINICRWSKEDCPLCTTCFGYTVESKVDVANFPNNAGRTFEETYVAYDVSTLITGTLNTPSVAYQQQYLQGRVSKTNNKDATTNTVSSTTYYSYDAHGRVSFVVQELPIFGLGTRSMYKTIDYVYKGLTSRVDKIIYQKGNVQEEFQQKYTYDDDYRITKAEVSRDGGNNWLPTAEYEYYLHGPLKRTGLGDHIQDEDFVYNINGWLKAINNPLTGPYTNDNGESTTAGDFAPDVFSEAINYYNGDYKRINVGLDNSALTVPQTSTDLFTNAKNLYSGNISSTVTNTAFNLTGMASPQGNILAQGYQYDYLNRLTDVYAEIQPENFTAFTGSGSGNDDYASHIGYDANGNITAFVRNTMTRVVSTSTNRMDDMSYEYAQKVNNTFHNKYYKINNRLAHVNDAAVDEAGLNDIKDQGPGYVAGTLSTHNYKYDAKGRIISDVQNGITSVEWTASDKVKKVIAVNGGVTTTTTVTYNAQQQRLSKKIDPAPAGGNDVLTTIYSYDASGILMATYEHAYDGASLSYQFKLLDHQMYGMGRVGTYNVDEILVTSPGTITNDANKQFFEITDHLGSVRAVVSGIKQTGPNAGNATIVQMTDYHEFGQTMRGRNFVNTAYRFGYQGSEKDAGADGGYYTTEFRALDVRLGRWLSPDPITHTSWSPYVSMNDNPIGITDVLGLEGDPVSGPDDGCVQGNPNDDAYVEWRIDNPGSPGTIGTGGGSGSNSAEMFSGSVAFTGSNTADAASKAQAVFNSRINAVVAKVGKVGTVSVTTNLDPAGNFATGTIEWDSPLEVGYEVITNTYDAIKNNPGLFITLPSIGGQINDDLMTRKELYYDPTMAEYGQISKNNISEADYAIRRYLRMGYTRSKLSPLGQAFSASEKSNQEAAKIVNKVIAGEKTAGKPRYGGLGVAMDAAKYQTFRIIGNAVVIWQINESANRIIDSKGDIRVIANEAGGWAGALMGAAMGAKAGFIVGTWLAPIFPGAPIVGAFIGGIVGGAAGWSAGSGEMMKD